MTTNPGGETVDFFIVPKRRESYNRQSWLIYRQSLKVCVDAASDADAAVEKAIGMAKFCMLGGHAAQVLIRNSQDAQWQTVWSERTPPQVG